MGRIFVFFLIAWGVAGAQTASVGAGVSRELARERAAVVSDVSYKLAFDLVAHADETRGTEELRFKLSKIEPLLIDFREGKVAELTLNGAKVAAKIEDGHIVFPAERLKEGENVAQFEFTAPVAPAGKAITRYEDKDDGSEYIYTLFVPMDASMAFPCFDQPDLKAKFQLTVTAPTSWTVISNTAPSVSEGPVGSTTRFAATKPLPTYLFAFAAGPFHKYSAAGVPSVYVRKSLMARAEGEIPAVERITQRGIDFFGDYFAQPYPFPKYEMVLIPGFAYGGMEHAGATFLNEDGVLFRTAPTDTDRFNRNILLLHELAHQWFGDFTTMRWFDDLWLKEGFAQYTAYKALAELTPEQQVWKRFYQQIKPLAYGIDVTKGTTPIYQVIPNLKDAKSAYGAIVYEKAPGLMRQLNFIIGDEAFRDGLRLYLKEHPYGNAEWGDLVHAFERTSGQSLTKWAEAWIQHRGMPVVSVEWGCAAGKISAMELAQRDVLGEGNVWPIATEVLLGYDKDPAVRLRAELDGAKASVAGAAGKTCPAYVFANAEDRAYGLFLLDAKSREYVLEHVGETQDVFERTLLWGALWDSVREAQLDAAKYLEAALRAMPNESDEALVQSLGGRSTVALHRYVNAGVRARYAPEFERVAIEEMQHAATDGLRIMWFRTLRAVAESPTGLNALKEILAEKLSVPGVKLRSVDRWSMVTTVVAQGDPEADKVLAAEKERDHTGEGLKYAYVAEAARATAATKKFYFDDYVHNAARPEDWVSQSLGAFNEWNQTELTGEYLRPALEALPQVKRERKIFFLLVWLNAFIGGQQSQSADDEVHQWLQSANLDPDLRLKVLEVTDELDRTVRIRKVFP